MSTDDRAVSDADLVAYVDGTLEPERAERVAVWLADHPEERARVERWAGQSEALRRALDPVVDEAVPEGLRAALARRSIRRWLPAAAAVAGIAVGLAAGFGLWGAGRSPAAEEIASVGLSAHEVYIQEVRHPIEVSVDDRDHLVAWLSNRIDFALTPPDLSQDGLQLLGGRVVPRDGEPAAMLMYEDDTGERFTLLIARAGAPEVTAFRYAEDNASGAYYWMGGEVGFVFAGPGDRNRLLALARSVYDQVSLRG